MLDFCSNKLKVTCEIIAAPDYDRSSWLNVKNTMGLGFPNVSIVQNFSNFCHLEQQQSA